MSFTHEQIQAIEQIVDSRIAALHRVKKPTTDKAYHTVPEIRDLIRLNRAELYDWFGADDFDISALRHFLGKKTFLRPGDLEPPGDGNSVSRWDSQVLSAINCHNWPDCPVIPAGRKRFYRMKPVALA